MSLPSGKNRFYEFDMKNDSIISTGLIAHGSCNQNFLANPKFSNKTGCGCTALGKYKVGYKYKGRFGNAYKLYGLDSSNSNAFKRNIVLHSYYMVPDKETFPAPICNSLGCAMISPAYISLLASNIDASARPMLLWIFE
jgi:L,D-transpeptidase catalytic domain